MVELRSFFSLVFFIFYFLFFIFYFLFFIFFCVSGRCGTVGFEVSGYRDRHVALVHLPGGGVRRLREGPPEALRQGMYVNRCSRASITLT